MNITKAVLKQMCENGKPLVCKRTGEEWKIKDLKGVGGDSVALEHYDYSTGSTKWSYPNIEYVNKNYRVQK